MANVCLHLVSESPLHLNILLWRGARRTTHVDLRILEPLLQIVVDGLVGNLAEQGKI
jgi:hypothetical protein